MNENVFLKTIDNKVVMIIHVDIINSYDDDFQWLYIDNKQVRLDQSISADTLFTQYNKYMESLDKDVLVVPKLSTYYLQRSHYDVTRYADFRDIPKSMIDY